MSESRKKTRVQQMAENYEEMLKGKQTSTSSVSTVSTVKETVAVTHPPEEQKLSEQKEAVPAKVKASLTEPGFLSENMLKLGVTLDDESIPLFTNPNFLNTIQEQAKDRHQSDANIGFLKAIYEANMFGSTKTEEEWFKLLDDTNVPDTLKKAAKKQIADQGLRAFDEVTKELIGLINTTNLTANIPEVEPTFSLSLISKQVTMSESKSSEKDLKISVEQQMPMTLNKGTFYIELGEKELSYTIVNSHGASQKASILYSELGFNNKEAVEKAFTDGNDMDLSFLLGKIKKEAVKNEHVSNEKIPYRSMAAVKAELHAAHEKDKQVRHDKSMLPYQTVICSALEKIEEKKIEPEEPKKTGTARLKSWIGSLKKPIKEDPTPEERSYNAAELQLEDSRNKLVTLLEQSTRLETEPRLLQKGLSMVMESLKKQEASLKEMFVTSDAKKAGNPHSKKILKLILKIVDTQNVIKENNGSALLKKPVEEHVREMKEMKNKKEQSAPESSQENRQSFSRGSRGSR